MGDASGAGNEEIARELERLLGKPAPVLEPVAGGDIGASFRGRTHAGERVFVKAYGGRDGAGMAAAEARGLAWLGEADVLRVAAVRAASAPDASPVGVLVLDWIEPGRATARTDEALGRGLARLHDRGADCFGAVEDNFVGRLPQSNLAMDQWVDFYRDRRLAPLFARARAAGLLSRELQALASRLLDRLDVYVGPAEPPARLHGDLWGGNWLCADDGAPVLIDPAAYGGHREMDLAMMRLFGGFSERVFDAYAEATNVAEDHAERLPLYQLYPLLVHLNLFGASYAPGVERALRRYA